jgi:hypothetical protein
MSACTCGEGCVFIGDLRFERAKNLTRMTRIKDGYERIGLWWCAKQIPCGNDNRWWVFDLSWGGRGVVVKSRMDAGS